MTSLDQTLSSKKHICKKIKVVHLLNELCYSGAEVMLRDANNFFKDNGIETTIISTGSNLGPYAGILEKCGYAIEHIPFRKIFSYFFQLYNFLKNNNFDVIHIHPERAYFFTLLLRDWHAPKK